MLVCPFASWKLGSRGGRSFRRLLTIGAVLVVVGSFARWVTSLGIDANSGDLRRLAFDLGFSDNGGFEVAVTLWVVVPILLIVAVGLAWLGTHAAQCDLRRPRRAYGGIVAFAVLQAPDIVLFDVEWGVPTVFVGALVVLVGVIVQVVSAITSRRNISAASE